MIGEWFGIPELAFFLVLGLFWLVPLVAGIWALFTLHKVRSTVDRIEQMLRAR